MLRKLLHKIRLKYVILGIILFIILKIFGVFTHIFEKDFYTEFHYPYDGDIQESVNQLRNNERPDIEPINDYNYNYITNLSNKCKTEEQIRIVYLIKSSPENFNRRKAIRNSWGYEHRFSDVKIRRVFLLGYRDDRNLAKMIFDESKKYSDILQTNFTDSYYNNTIKTMVGFKWASTFCANAKFYMFVDDDFYVSTKNVLRYLRNPTNYPQYLKEPIISLKNVLIKKRQIDFELPDDVKLYTGFVFHTPPHRHFTSKWYVSLDEYPYHLWPPYVAAGAYILSREALLDMYYSSFFTKHFRFDDVYIGLLALKSNIEPYHSNEFYFYKKKYERSSYTFTIAAHGFNDPNELVRIWQEQKSLGNA